MDGLGRYLHGIQFALQHGLAFYAGECLLGYSPDLHTKGREFPYYNLTDINGVFVDRPEAHALLKDWDAQQRAYVLSTWSSP